MTEIGLVIFDCDGVLVDSEPIANRLLAEALSKAGLPTSYDEARRRYVGLSMATCMKLFEEQLGGPLPESWLDDLQAETFARFSAELTSVEGVSELIRIVQERAISTCVASSGDLTKINLSLTTTGLLGLFGGHIFSASMVPRGKPHPDLFLLAAERMGVSPERSVVIEDSVPGVQAAVAAGMRVLAYAGDPHTDGDALARAGGTVFYAMRDAPLFT